MTVKNSVFVICFQAIIYLLVYNVHDCTIKIAIIKNVKFLLNKQISL